MCCSVVLGPRAEEGSATNGGGQSPAELDYASLMRGDRRHSLPPPISLSLHTTHTDICNLSNSSPCFSHLDHFILKISHLQRFKRPNPSLLQNITIQKCLAQEQDRCIIQMTVKALYQSFMWISSSRLEKRERGGYLGLLFALQPQISVCSYYFNGEFYRSSPLTVAQLTTHTHTTNILNQSDSGNEAKMAWQDFNKTSAIKSDLRNYLLSVAVDWEFSISGLSVIVRKQFMNL